MTLSPIYRKVAFRLIPILFSCYILAYIDRVNVGFAKLAMHDVPWFSDAVFATGAGIFFLGYFLFEVPANLILQRTGARLWIARIMISWGIISTLMAFSYNATSFYILRFLLGVAEAGFFPGIILYLTYWFPREHRAHMTAMFMTAVAAAGILGSPISGWILQVSDGWHGECSKLLVSFGFVMGDACACVFLRTKTRLVTSVHGDGVRATSEHRVDEA